MRSLVGLHGRNDVHFENKDFEVLHIAKIELLKMMSTTNLDTFQRIRNERPETKFIVRLYDDRFNANHRVSPGEFAERMVPLVNQFRPYCDQFQIHNEPNHPARYEGWGSEDNLAEDFNRWFIDTYNLLKSACPWAAFGFPGLAVPHNDLSWLEICRPAIERADWLGCHSYWQNPTPDDMNHLSAAWGLNFTRYHEKHPGKAIHILEAGNSNHQSGYPLPDWQMAQEMVEWYREVMDKHPYVRSASPFLLSSPDPNWADFSWRVGDTIREVAWKVGEMLRPPLT